MAQNKNNVKKGMIRYNLGKISKPFYLNITVAFSSPPSPLFLLILV